MIANSQLGTITMKTLDRNLLKTKQETVSLSSFCYLYSEMLQYAHKNSAGISELETKLSEYGYRVGIRLYELHCWRERISKRESKLINMLTFICSNVWKIIFSKPADALEKGTDSPDEFFIIDNEPLLTKYISVPREFSSLNPGAFIAGMLEAILDTSQFPCQVTAHSTSNDNWPIRTTVFLFINY